MSYSFSVKRATKEELEVAVRDELVKVAIGQPAHEKDIDQAFNAAKSLIDLMYEDAARDLQCSVCGSIYRIDAGVENVSVSINLSHQARDV